MFDPYGGSNDVYTFSSITQTGNVETLWLVEHNPDGSLDEASSFTGSGITLCWQGFGVTPAMATTLYYKTITGEYKASRAGFDPDAGSRSPTNNFSSIQICGHGLFPTMMLSNIKKLGILNAFSLGNFPLTKQFAFRYIISGRK